METILRGSAQVDGYFNHVTLVQGLVWGLVGGLAGTLFMDIVLIGALSAAGMPAFTCFSIVGNTVARFFSILGINMAGGTPLGVATHYLVGPAVGLIFGVALVKIDSLQLCTLKKCIVVAVLYVEILSQPLLAMTPLLLNMSGADTLQWFGASFVMHFMLGVVLGTVVYYGLRLATTSLNLFSFSARIP